MVEIQLYSHKIQLGASEKEARPLTGGRGVHPAPLDPPSLAVDVNTEQCAIAAARRQQTLVTTIITYIVQYFLDCALIALQTQRQWCLEHPHYHRSNI